MTEISPTEKSFYDPALAVWDNKLYIAWTDLETQHLSYMPAIGGTQPTIVKDYKSTHGSAISVLDGDLYMAWVDSSNTLQVMNVTDSSTDPISMDVTTGAAPALAVLDKELYVAWTDDDNQVNVMTVSDRSPISLPYSTASNNAPALAALGNDLYLAWTDTDDNGSMYLAKASSDSSTQPIALQQQSVNGPALAVLDGTMYAAFTGYTTNSVHVMPLPTLSWSGSGVVCAPALAAYQKTLYVAWVDSSTVLNLDSVDTSSAPTNLPSGWPRT